MKLVVAIINTDDTPGVMNGLTRNGYSATKLATSGSFLRTGNATLLIGVEDEKVDDVIAIIGEFSSKRKQMMSTTSPYGAEGFLPTPVEISVGGATVFVLDVDKFCKL